MTTYYSVDKSIQVRNSKGEWLDPTADQLRDCLEIDPATTDDAYSILVFENYDDAVAVALDGIDPESREQFPIFTWETDGKAKNSSFKLDDGSKLKAKRIEIQEAELVSASLEHVNDRYEEVFFDAPENSAEADSDEEIEVKPAAPAPTRAQRWVNNGKWAAGKVRDSAVDAASRPSVQATAVAATVSTGAAAAALNTTTGFLSTLPGAGYVATGAGYVASGLSTAASYIPGASYVSGAVSTAFDTVVPAQYREPIKVALAVGAAVEGSRQLYNHSGSMLNAFNKLRGAKPAANADASEAKADEKRSLKAR
ncbi:MAG: hypothetical protein JSR17_07720 [Proteobacteria bacterium]|nr:hypothetical protein [Pseudomonadota bacterium]